MSECIFCRIVQGEISADKKYEDEEFLAFTDINPQAPFHYLIIPKKHVSNLMEIQDEDMVGRLFSVIRHLAKEEKLDEKGFRVVNNCGEEGGQTVDHIHFHLLGGRFMNWPPG